MKPLGIGIIGLMGFGRVYFKTLRAIPGVHIAAVCDANEAVLKEVADCEGVTARYTDYKKMLEQSNVDAVFIATPHFLHRQMTLDALQAGKHVFCEKPLAMNAAQADEMALAARTAGLKLTCHFNRRQSVAVKMLRDAVQHGVLGDVYAFNVKWMARYTAFMFAQQSSWRTSKAKAGGGILIGRGSHMIDAALYILGMPRIVSISANICSKLTGFEVDDYAMVMLRLANGALIHMECSYEANLPNYAERLEYQVFGKNAGAYSVQQDGGQPTFEIGRCAFPQNRWEDMSEKFDMASYEKAYPVSIIEDFIDAIRNEREPLIRGEDGAYISRILDAAYESGMSGREVVL